jgi:hypothetical protein
MARSSPATLKMLLELLLLASFYPLERPVDFAFMLVASPGFQPVECGKTLFISCGQLPETPDSSETTAKLALFEQDAAHRTRFRIAWIQTRLAKGVPDLATWTWRSLLLPGFGRLGGGIIVVIIGSSSDDQ